MRVFIRDDPDQISRLVTPKYATVLIEDLARDLAEHHALQKASLLGSPRLEEAIYVARLEGNVIVSDHSRWKLRGLPSTQPLELGSLSLALRSARGVLPNSSQLVDNLFFTASGALELTLPSGNADHWFGFTTNSVERSSIRSFQFRVPLAIRGTMLLAAPANMELSSPTVVVEKIAAPTTCLPQDWSVASTPSAGPGTNWWRIHLSGVSTFELNADQRRDTSLSAYEHLVRFASVEYAATDHLLDVHGRFVVAGLRRNQPLKLRIGTDLRIASVLAASLPVQWRVCPSAEQAWHEIEITGLTPTEFDIVVELDAACPLDTNRPAQLPEVSVLNSYTMDGESLVFGRDSLVADTLDAGTSFLKRVPIAQRIARESHLQAEQLVWQASWLGDAPQLEATFAHLRRTWTANSLTRFSTHSDWLAANCRIRLESPLLDSNEIRLLVGNNWFIDSIKVVQTGSDIRASVEDRQNAANPVVVVAWEGKRDRIALELEVLAHSPRDTKAEMISLRSPRLVTLPGAEQIDNYAIEPSSRYAVQIGASLLRFQLQPEDLPPWQRQLLPPQTNRWLFQGVRGTMPPISLAASSGIYTSSVKTLVRSQAEGFVADVQILCVPTVGSIDRVGLDLPESLRNRELNWTIHQNDSSHDMSSSVPEPSVGEIVQTGSDRLVEVELSIATTQPFILRTHVPLNIEGDVLPVPVIGIPAAVQGECILVVPKSVATPVELTQWELLSAEACSTDSNIAEMFGTFTEDNRSDFVAARIDAGVSHTLQLQIAPAQEPTLWAWSERTRHQVQESGLVRHDMRWIVEGAQASHFDVTLPTDWTVQDLQISGQKADIAVVDQTMRLELETFEQTQGVWQVHLTCISQRAELGWFGRNWLTCEQLPGPVVSMPVLERRLTLVLPPSRVALRSLTTGQLSPTAELRLSHRLFPSTWWNLLNPNSFALNRPIPDQQSIDAESDFAAPIGWNTIQVFDERPGLVSSLGEMPDRGNKNTTSIRIWTVSQTAVAAIALAALLSLTTAFGWILGSNLRLWWLVGTVGAIAIVIMPVQLLPITQFGVLAFCLAAMLKLCSLVSRLNSDGLTVRSRSAIMARANPPTLMLMLLTGWCGATHAQSPPLSSGSVPPVNAPTGNGASAIDLFGIKDSASGTGVPRRGGVESTGQIYSVLIPINDSGEVSGRYAYAPTQLLELLAGGGETTPSLIQPRLLSADYTLRTKRSLVGLPDTMQEFSVEFRVNVTHADTELRLPFQRSQVILQRGNVGGQELFVGGRSLEQDATAIVYRPSSPGTYRLQLQLQPVMLTQTAVESTLQCTIPPIPNATLRIVADGNSQFEIRSLGASPKSVSSVSNELLGPISQLDVRWTPANGRSAMGQPSAVVFSDTWLHARGSQLSAVCQLRISNARSLPSELHIQVEPGWEPVGLNWGDGQLVAKEVSTLAGRRIYTIRCSDNSDALALRNIRVIMVPENTDGASSLSLPFFSVREVSQQALTRTLAWSTEETEPAMSAWKPEGLEYWQELTLTSAIDWGGLQWKAQPKFYRVLNTMAASIQRVAALPENTISEATQIHLGVGECKTEYRGEFLLPDSRLIALSIPKDAQVQSVLLDGVVPNYRVSQRADRSLIEILPSENVTSHKLVEVLLGQALKLNTSTSLPRVFMQTVTVRSSNYSVFCGAGLTCEISEQDALKLETGAGPSRALLIKLERLVGQVELLDGYRDVPWLPLMIQVHRQNLVPVMDALLTIDRTDQGWRASVRATWETPRERLDFAFFELPVAVRDVVDTGTMPAQFIPMGDSGRMTLRVLPPDPVDGKTEVKFSFPLLAASSGQSVPIPQVAILSNTQIRPVLALPSTLDDQPIQWAQTGRKLDRLKLLSDDDSSSNESVANGFHYFDLESTQSQANWKRLVINPSSASLLATQVALLQRQGDCITGCIDYWLDPSWQANLAISLPPQSKVLSVQIGGHAAIWKVEQGQLSVLLQPNYLPIGVRVLLQWTVPNSSSCTLPFPSVALPEQADALRTIDNQLDRLAIQSDITRQSEESVRQAMSHHWAKLLLASFPKLKGASTSELQSWLRLWKPQNIGLYGNELVAAADVELAVSVLDIKEGGFGTTGSVDDLWLMFLTQADLGTQDVDLLKKQQSETSGLSHGSYSVAQAFANSSRVAREQIAFDQTFDRIELLEQKPVRGGSAQLAAAGLLAAASLLTIVLAGRLGRGYMLLLGLHPWIYWVQLAALAWLILPVSWPSWVLLLTSQGMLISQVLDTRRRQRMLSRV